MEKFPKTAARIGLVLVVTVFLSSTLPYLGDYPTLDWAQMGIAAPAHKLASQGVYGNDLFTGFHRNELRNYEYMPAYPLLVALSFKFLGLGVWQARIVSVIAGLTVVLLTYHVGRQLYDRSVGLAAAAVLCTLRLGTSPTTSGIPLLDFSRIIRYDILVPVFVLAASSVFLSTLASRAKASREGSVQRGGLQTWGLLLTGFLAGVATLSHLYGAFIMLAFAILLVWQERWSVMRRPSTYLLPMGWFLALAPWLLYVGQDLEAYGGQMSRHQYRFDILNPSFYWNNLTREYHRYGEWVGGFPEGLLTPRVGIWLLLFGIGASFIYLYRRCRAQSDLADRFLLLALPTMMAMLGLMLNLKRYVYTVVLLPFIALQLGLMLVVALRWLSNGNRVAKLGVALVAALAVLEGGLGITRALNEARQTTPYREVTDAIADELRAGSLLLISQPYWLGLAAFDTRSVNLVYVQTPLTSLEQSMREIAPDYVILERYFLDPSIGDPRASSSAEVLRWWQQLENYLSRECPTIVTTIPDPSYGTIDVYSCGD